MKAFKTKHFAASWQRGVLLFALGQLSPDDLPAEKRELIRGIANWALSHGRNIK
jgi:hypothetical protein